MGRHRPLVIKRERYTRGKTRVAASFFVEKIPYKAAKKKNYAPPKQSIIS